MLVDSRTDISETGGLCIGPLSDQVVVLTALNDQNIQGTRKFLGEVGILEIPEPAAEVEARPELPGPRLDTKPYLIVANLVPSGEIEKKRERLRELQVRIGKAVVKLSYQPQMALEESIFTRDYRDEYLAREYEDLLLELLRMADDGPDYRPPAGLYNDPLPKGRPVEPAVLAAGPRPTAHDGDPLPAVLYGRTRGSAEFRQALSRQQRTAWVKESRSVLLYCLWTTNFGEIQDETDFVLWDRV